MAIRDLTARIILSANTQGLSTGFKQAESSIEKFGTTIERLQTLVLGGGAVSVAIKGFEELQKAANLEAQEESLRRTLASVNVDFDSFISKLRDVSDATVATSDLVASSSRALLLGIPATQIADLLEVAKTRAIATGQDVGRAFDDITTGIGRLSPLILDNLGFTIKLSDAFADYAKQIGKTVEELTKQEQQQAVTNKLLEEGRRSTELFGNAAEGAATQFQQLTAAYNDAKDAVARYGADQTQTNVVVNEFFESLKDMFQLISGKETLFQQFVDRNERLAAAIEGVAAESNKMVVAFDKLVASGKDPLDVFNELTIRTQKAAAAEAEYERNLKTLTDAGFSAADAMKILADSKERLLRLDEQLTKQTDDYTKLLDTLNVKTDTELNKSIGALNDALQITDNLYSTGSISLDDYTRRTTAITAELDKLRAQLTNTTPEVQNLKDAVDNATDSQGNLEDATNNVTDASSRLEDQLVSTREELVRTADQALVTARAFDEIEKSQGRAAAEAAAIAGGGQLILGGTRINLPGGGSRLVITRQSTSSSGVAPAGGGVGSSSKLNLDSSLNL